jgi:hypothetical protein
MVHAVDIPISPALSVAAIQGSYSDAIVGVNISTEGHFSKPLTLSSRSVPSEEEYFGDGECEDHIISERKLEKHNKPKHSSKKARGFPQSPRKIMEIYINGERVPINGPKIKIEKVLVNGKKNTGDKTAVDAKSTNSEQVRIEANMNGGEVPIEVEF